jgi:hypothetical protein
MQPTATPATVPMPMLLGFGTGAGGPGVGVGTAGGVGEAVVVAGAAEVIVGATVVKVAGATVAVGAAVVVGEAVVVAGAAEVVVGAAVVVGATVVGTVQLGAPFLHWSEFGGNGHQKALDGLGLFWSEQNEYWENGKGGMTPVNAFPLNPKSVKRVNRESDDGMVPFALLEPKTKYVICPSVQLMPV